MMASMQTKSILPKRDYRNIVFLTGAGISAESGIKTFRDQGGLWEGHRVEDVATVSAFTRDPNLVHTFYNKRKEQLFSGQVKPNKGHFSLAKLEKDFAGKISIITQNVDNLHEKAGSKNILHMHGELGKIRCMKSNTIYSAEGPVNTQSICLCCNESSHLRPHIVWFGEMPFYLLEIETLLSQCDLFVAVGTSGQVQPASAFVQIAKGQGAFTIEVNLASTVVSQEFDDHLLGKVTEQLPKLVEQILKMAT